VTRHIPNFALAYGNPAKVGRRIGVGGEQLFTEDGMIYRSKETPRIYEVVDLGTGQLRLLVE
jgi:hypothetical protein